MNIFVVDTDPVVAAQSLHDRHVVKMVLETTQLLCTVAHQHGIAAPYKPTHAKHPCTVWAGATWQNCTWLWLHGTALCAEYTRRFGKTHACEPVIRDLRRLLTDCDLDPSGQTPFAQVVPPDCAGTDTVEAYRLAYRRHKLPGNRYTRREMPAWAGEPC